LGGPGRARAVVRSATASPGGLRPPDPPEERLHRKEDIAMSERAFIRGVRAKLRLDGGRSPPFELAY
jgi:hypothetical protein